MGIKLQNKLILWVLQPLGTLMSKFSEKQREILFCGSGLMIFLANFVYNSMLIEFRFLYLYTFDCIMFGLMILAILPLEHKSICFDPWLFIPWTIATLLMLIAGLMKTVDYLPDTMLFLFAFPIFYIVGNNCDLAKIQQLLFRIVSISFIIFLCVNILFFPIFQQQYCGFFSNVNAEAAYLALVFSVSLLQILEIKKVNKSFWLHLIFAGISATLIYYSNSRTGESGALAAFLLTALLLLFTNHKQFFRLFCFRFVPVILSITFFLPTTIYLFRLPQFILNTIPQIIQPEQPGQSDQITPSTPSSTDILTQIQETTDQKTISHGRTLDEMTSGRIGIWMEYLAQLRFWGHSMKDEDRFFIESRGTYNSTAHMTILDYAYNYGILAGGAYLTFNLFAGIKSISFAIRKPRSLYVTAPFTISVAFGIMSIFNSYTTPFYSMIAFYYYLIQCPLVQKRGSHDA